MKPVKANWPAPKHVHAFCTTRSGGMSQAPYDTLNLAYHVGDDEKYVESNRHLLKKILYLPTEPIWLEQTHSTIVLPITETCADRKADASFTHEINQVCVVMTADCLPILLCNRQGTHVAAIHAGWRGLANGIIEKTLQMMNLPPEDILAWFGPAIGPTVYEVGDEVRQCFLQKDRDASNAFIATEKEGHWLANLYHLARLQLYKQDISAIYGGEYCTYSDKERFFSYRRDGSKTGRMASLIWMTK